MCASFYIYFMFQGSQLNASPCLQRSDTYQFVDSLDFSSDRSCQLVIVNICTMTPGENMLHNMHKSLKHDFSFFRCCCFCANICCLDFFLFLWSKHITHLMKPVSEVITSPGTTRSFLSKAEIDRDVIVFLTVGNLMSTAMLPLRVLSSSLPFTAASTEVYLKLARYRRTIALNVYFSNSTF